ncbi:hypothetical protein BGX23_008009 [Mortierella sp. AD031]|nr:hypothetical protein BGX23_008009 [Mortierella sp. AD031]
MERPPSETWHHGCTVLMGDACHKLHPAAGAVTAIHGAVALANLIYAMPSTTSEEITETFKEYQEERYPAVIDASKDSDTLKNFSQRGIQGKITLFLATNVPLWLWKVVIQKIIRHRQQLGFVPAIPLMGTVLSAVSPSTEKARAVYQKLHGAAAA